MTFAPSSAEPEGRPAIQLVGLRKAFGDVVAVDETAATDEQDPAASASHMPSKLVFQGGSGLVTP